MTDPVTDVVKVSYAVPVSEEQLADAEHWSAAYRRQWRREAEAKRAQERADAPRVPLTIDALLDRLGWTQEYALHAVQPYCECSDGYDGWDYCEHARDEGLTP